MDRAAEENDYSQWTTEQLVRRVELLEQRLKSQQTEWQAEQDQRRKEENHCETRLATPANPTTSDQPIQNSANSSLAQEAKSQKGKETKTFDSTLYATNLIALKFAYLGQYYNGFEYHANNTTPLPTVEEELWKALTKAKLIVSDGDFMDGKFPSGSLWHEELEYSKCGRTDRGVSAFGQVIGIRLRSRRKKYDSTLPRDSQPARDGHSDAESNGHVSSTVTQEPDKLINGSHNEELPYAKILNRLLPPPIRVLAWCLDPPDGFSARFHCKARTYKYFFTNPAFSHDPAEDASGCTRSSGYLDINRMRDAVKYFIGLHDFRNFSKLDPSKQLTSFVRRVYDIHIEEHSHNGLAKETDAVFASTTSSINSDPFSFPPKTYCVTITGSAFLWHQVRHMVAILFHIGQGLESPSILKDLLNIHSTPCKPMYEMADDKPLVLWDCIFASQARERVRSSTENGALSIQTNSGQDEKEAISPGVDEINWTYVGEESSTIPSACTKFGPSGLVPELWQLWRDRKMDEILTGSLLSQVIRTGRSDGVRSSRMPSKQSAVMPCQDAGVNPDSTPNSSPQIEKKKKSDRIFLGGNTYRLAGTYVPLMQRRRLDSVETINQRWKTKYAHKTSEVDLRPQSSIDSVKD